MSGQPQYPNRADGIQPTPTKRNTENYKDRYRHLRAEIDRKDKQLDYCAKRIESLEKERNKAMDGLARYRQLYSDLKTDQVLSTSEKRKIANEFVATHGGRVFQHEKVIRILGIQSKASIEAEDDWLAEDGSPIAQMTIKGREAGDER